MNADENKQPVYREGRKRSKNTAICVLTKALSFFRVLCVFRGQKVLLLP